MRAVILGMLLAAGPALAHDAVIDGATARSGSSGWSFSVTLTHAETGWDDYADGWRVETESGEVLGTRVLAHPHENEQPFTRSLSGVIVPDGTSAVWIRARTSVDGWAEDRFQLELP
ncbi:hypothetical protein ALP8811_00458 [Aliiroseovarius pelagivivens]|uniref:Uncharacterized protein n=1 Tax=Aliiroseovarius pelagivivens TaxID=1639690 RepID=A0A2R8AHF8_9RHOB|nr:hypothetical protein [Aliiroseovarius pelagivivens]SPF75470.1 hypothetical protein ALP8811_00458 [Aliiroseovarius pelagivivens]